MHERVRDAVPGSADCGTDAGDSTTDDYEVEIRMNDLDGAWTDVSANRGRTCRLMGDGLVYRPWPRRAAVRLSAL